MPVNFPAFKPHPLLRGGHVQTIVGCYLPWRSVPYRAVQHLVPLADGDKIVLHDDLPAAWQPGGPVALLAHGLGGCHLSGYMRRGVIKLNDRGVRVFRMDLRGCGAGLVHARHPIHAGRSDDAVAAVEHVRQLCPQSPIHVVGFSISANIVLKMAGEMADNPPPELASLMAVAPPIDLIECSENIQRGANRLYDQSFLSGLLKSIERRKKLVPGALTRPFTTRPRRLVDFDNQFTAPLTGFADVFDYYQRASAGPYLKSITVPTLIVTAATDPIVPVTAFERASYSESTELVVTSCGGHLGFIGRGGVDPDRRWLDWRMIEWIIAHAPERRRLPPPSHVRHPGARGQRLEVRSQMTHR
jgi:predicted alpha/beta-fold hydrolase